MNRIVHGDCLEIMKDIEDKSIDLIVIDPPYNIKKAEWDSWKTVDEYVKWMGLVFAECERVLKKNGSFYFFHNDFLQIVELQNWINKNTKFVFKQFITWSKMNPSFKNYSYIQHRLSVNGMRNYYKGFTEYCLFYTFQDGTGLEKILPLCFKPYLNYMTEQKGLIGWSNADFNRELGYKSISSHWFWNKNGTQNQPCFISEKDYIKLQRTGYFNKSYEALKQEYESLRKEYESNRKDYEKLRYSFNNSIIKANNSNVWVFDASRKKHHITQKPVDLIENIVNHSSNEGDTVLDCFMGSGTTAVACVNTNRNFIGIEKDWDNCLIANERIKEIKRELTLEPV